MSVPPLWPNHLPKAISLGIRFQSRNFGGTQTLSIAVAKCDAATKNLKYVALTLDWIRSQSWKDLREVVNVCLIINWIVFPTQSSENDMDAK